MRNVRSASWPISQRPTIGTATPGYTHDFGVVGIPMLDRNRNITPIHPHTYLRQHLHRLPALSCQHPRQGQKPNRLLVLTDVGQHCQGRQITHTMVDEFEKYVAETLKLNLTDDGCGKDSLYYYLFDTVPVFRGKRGRPAADNLALVQQTREFFRSMIGCFDGMYTDYEKRIKIEFDDGHVRNIVDVFLEMPDCCIAEVGGKVHTWPAWLGSIIHATLFYESNYFTVLSHPINKERKFAPASTIGCFFSGWWFGYLLWCKQHKAESEKLVMWLTASGLNTYRDLDPSKLIDASYQPGNRVLGAGNPATSETSTEPERRHTVTEDSGNKRKSIEVGPLSFLLLLLGRLDYFSHGKDNQIEPKDFSWIMIDKSSKLWPRNLNNLDKCGIANADTLNMRQWDLNQRLKIFAETVIKVRKGRKGCVRVSRRHSYTDAERKAEKSLEKQADFHKTVLFDWPFLLRPLCSGGKAKSKAS